MNTLNDNREGGLNNCTQKNSLMLLETLKNVFRLLIMPAFELGYIYLQVKNVRPPLLVIFLLSWDNEQAAVFRLIILPAFELGNIFLKVKNVGPPLVVFIFAVVGKCI